MQTYLVLKERWLRTMTCLSLTRAGQRAAVGLVEPSGKVVPILSPSHFLGVSVKAAKASLNIHLAEEVYVIPGPDRIELLHRIAEIAAMRVRDAAGLSHEVSFVPALNPLEMIPVIHELDGLRA